MKGAMTLLAALLLTRPALAAPDEYAMGLIVHPEGQAMVRVAVPSVIYQTVTSAALDDVAVFNGDGEPVPFAIRRPPVATERWSDWHTLPVFALPEGPEPGDSGSRINVQLAGDGTVVAIEGAVPEARSTRFLIDASEYSAPMDRLRLEWVEVAAGFVAEARIEGSDDLSAWEDLGASATLAALSSNGHRIAQNEIELPSADRRYLRLTLARASTPLEIRQVDARTRRTAPQPRASMTLAGSLRPGNRNVLEYDTGGRFPVDRIALALPYPNQALAADVYSRDGLEDSARRHHGEHLFYRVDAAGASESAPRTSPPLTLPATPHPHWSLETEQAFATDAPVPGLEVSWLPHEIVFLEQGPGPFTLAFGRGESAPSRWPLSRLQAMLDAGTSLSDLPQARTGQLLTLGGAERLAPSARLPWPRIALWSVLVLGVLLIGGFAWHLVRGSERDD